MYISMCVCVFVNNFLVPIQVRLSPNFVSHTLGHRVREVITFRRVKDQGRWGRYVLY